jgi:hypothetical protein
LVVIVLVFGEPMTAADGPLKLGLPTAVVGLATWTQASAVVGMASPLDVATTSLWFSPVS